jgi:hypothetical protein
MKFTSATSDLINILTLQYFLQSIVGSVAVMYNSGFFVLLLSNYTAETYFVFSIFEAPYVSMPFGFVQGHLGSFMVSHTQLCPLLFCQ